MTRYYAITMKSMDMAHVPENATEPYGRYVVVKADEAEAAIRELVEGIEQVIDALRVQARMALAVGGEIAMNEDNAAAWNRAKSLIAKYKEDA
jgi:hypothetical protein